MEAFKTRLIQEYVELDERTEKLEEFILKILNSKASKQRFKHRCWLKRKQ